MKMLMQEDPDVATGLKNLRRVDPTDIEGAALTFEGLVDGGENIPVTSANVEEYVNRKVRHLVLDKIEPQMTAMAAGVYDVLPLGMWSFLTVEELSDLIRGTKEIDIADLKKATSYSPKSTKDDIIVEWFWEIVGGFSDTENEDFLRFVSGSPFPPMHGFSGITGTQTWFQIVIESGLYLDQVPIAQTCFAQLRMPRYTSRDIMRTRLLTAFENAKSLENA
jgi:E3 ubiquitin-protein ligase HUWE1